MYAKNNVTIKPGVTVFIGTNGAGKTTLLIQLKEQLERNKIPCVYFDNLTEGGGHARDRAGLFGEMNFLLTAACSSEGENIVMNMGKTAAKIGRMTKLYENSDEKELWILLDAIDSGLSIDNVVDIKEHLFKPILESPRCKDKDVYILVVANEYEMVRGEECLDVQNLKYRRFKTYESYRKYILKSKELKMLRDHPEKKGEDEFR
jgi:GTPase SAR1 family protein